MKIFIGYRRDDARGSAGRIYDRLASWYGPKRVFRDVDRIATGANFVEAVRQAIESCDVMLVVMGPDWASIADDTGRARLQQPGDHVRTEVELALAAGVRIVPVLVTGAAMPAAEALPDQVRPLTRLNAVEVRETRFEDDLDHLIEEIGGRPRLRAWAGANRGRTAAIAGTGLAAVAAGVLVLGGGGPSPLSGDFVVAVAEFGVGGDADPGTARELADGVFETIDEALTAFEAAGDFAELVVAGPATIGVIEGDSAEERAAAAEELAEDISADVVIYGNLATTGGGTRFSPEFYLADTARLENAEELAGTYVLGDVSLPTTNPVAVSREVAGVLEGRAAALVELIVGLSYYSVDDWRTADRHLMKAESGWPDAAGREVVLHMLGNVSGKQGAPFFDQARGYYEQALATEPGYARSLFGIAELDFQAAKGETCGGEGPTDAAGVEAAIQGYRDAVARDAPPRSHLDVRGRLHVARAYVCLEAAGEGPQPAAVPELEAVIAANDGQSRRLADMAAEAHQLLGLILVLSGEPRSALAEYDAALALTLDDERRVYFHTARAVVYMCYLDEPDRATQEYEAADRLAGSPVERAGC